METMPTPLPELKINSKAKLTNKIIKSKNYEIPFNKDIYILLMEKYEDDKIYFQLRKRNNFSLYHCIYEYKEIMKLFFLQTEIYYNISKIFNYLDSVIKEKKMNLEYNEDNKNMILKLRRELDQKEVDCIIKLKEIKIQNND